MDDFSFVKKIKEGDRRSWNMMIDRYSKPVYNIALNFCKNPEDASDITQEIFLKIFRNIDKMDEKFNFTSWVLRVSKNHCIDHWRKNRKNYNIIEFSEKTFGGDDTPEKNFVKENDIIILRRMLMQLKPDAKLLIILRDIRGHSYKEISEIMNIPEGTVKSGINRARLKLAEIYRNGN